ncbi:MAG: hypothetical protein AAFQ57_03780 [Cyanobacteria bacterium J06626_14]
MVDSQSSVLLLQSDQFQGLVWKTVLQSQRIAVIWESPETDLKKTLARMTDADLTLPRLLILDVQCLGSMPFSFCRWCNAHYPSIVTVLTDHEKPEISDPERDWAIAQGAADFFLGFQSNNFVGSAILCVRRVFQLLEQQMNPVDLMSVLSELEQTHLSSSQPEQASLKTNVNQGEYVIPAQPILTWRGQIVAPPVSSNGALASDAPSAQPPNPPRQTNQKNQRLYRGRPY